MLLLKNIDKFGKFDLKVKLSIFNASLILFALKNIKKKKQN